MLISANQGIQADQLIERPSKWNAQVVHAKKDDVVQTALRSLPFCVIEIVYREVAVQNKTEIRSIGERVMSRTRCDIAKYRGFLVRDRCNQRLERPNLSITLSQPCR